VCDLRAEKTFRIALSTVGAYVDVFNLTNQGIANRVSAVSGPNFGTPAAWSDPRVLRAGLRVSF
jgi:hypothetical protein